MSNIIARKSINSIEELNNFIQYEIIENIKFRNVTKHFRGQVDKSWVLQTRIAAAYGDNYTAQLKANEIFNSFRRKLREAQLISEIYTAGMNQGLYESVYYTVFQAQHIGVPTTFMDWSFNWRNGLYFAIDNENYIDTPGVLWIMLRPYYDEDNIFSLNPYYLKDTVLINAAYDADVKLDDFLGEKNRRNQAGEFLILPHNNCIEPLETNNSLAASLIQIEITPEFKHQIFELREKEVDDDFISLMRTLRLDFTKYNAQNIYGNMSDELKNVINDIRDEFGFSLL